MVRANCRRHTVIVPLLPHHNRRKDDELRCLPQLESLEPRYLMTASAGADWQNLISAGGICQCSICTGQGLPTLQATDPVGSGGEWELSHSNPLSSLPVLNSNPGATAKLYLDFNGNTEASWGGYSNVVTPVFSQDGDLTTFSNAELAAIQEIWARVAEDFAPYNINVTTVDPGNNANGVVARIAIGGNYSDWFGSSAGGVAYIGGFYNGAPNVGYVFEDALGNGNARYVAEAASHEAGHLFGLRHQALWSGTTLSQPYYQGNADWAPIMGVGYYSTRTTWHNGTTDQSYSTYQDDMAILANASNAFGYRADDYGSSQALASALPAAGGSVNFAGRIGNNTDEDWFVFTSSGGALNLTLNVAQFGANLDSILELRNSTGTIVVSSNPGGSLGASLATTIGAGTFYVVVKSTGGYGNVGQYTLTGTAPVGGGGGGGGGEETTAPEIEVLVGATNVASGGTVNFGSVQVGQTASRTFTIRNSGNANLTVNTPLAAQLPAGYSIASNITDNNLAPGETTSLTITFAPGTVGTINGLFNLFNNDEDEGTFGINFTGTATAVPAPEITVSVGGVNVNSGGTVNFGSVEVGQTADRTITFTNTGNASLTLTTPVAGDLPAGYSIVTNIATTTLLAGQSTSMTVRFAPAATGTIGGLFNLANSDADEGNFGINFTGTATAVAAPEIAVSVGGTNVNSGGTVNFGSVLVGQTADRTITITNTGNATLTVNTPIAAHLPTGYSIVTNISTNSLLAGQSTTLTIRFAPTAAGTIGGLFNLFNSDADEGIFGINFAGTATAANAPEISVSVGGVNINSGDTLDFGNVQVGQSVNRTITITNTGNATLTVNRPLAVHLPAGFTIVTNTSSTSLAAGQSTTLTVKFTPTAVGVSGGLFNLFNSDADEGTFGINFTGNGTAAAVVRAIDNGAAGFTKTGTWLLSYGGGRERDVHTAAKGTGTFKATWTFNSLPPGQYRVHASWTGGTANATNAPFTIFNGTTALSTVAVNQEVASAGFTWGGTNWSELGTFNITGTTLRVQLTNAANDRVVADAIRIERIGELAPAVAASSPLAGSFANSNALPELAHLEFDEPVIGSFPVASFTAGNPDAGLSRDAIDNLFATPDAQAELLLLTSTLDLLQATSSDELDEADPPAKESLIDPIGNQWLMGDELDLLLT